MDDMLYGDIQNLRESYQRPHAYLNQRARRPLVLFEYGRSE